MLIFSLAILGCSAQEKEEVIVAPPPVEEVIELEPEPEILHVGNGPITFEAVNASDMTITQIQFKLPDAGEFEEDKALENLEIPPGEEFAFAPNFLTGDEDMEEVTSFDVLLTFDYDGSDLDLLLGDFPVSDFSSLRFMFEDDVAFVEYHDDINSEIVSTKDNELARLADAAAAAEEERLAAEAPAPTPTPAPAPTPTPAPAPTPTPAPAPDVCIEEPILRY